jgi:hypothetical protein
MTIEPQAPGGDADLLKVVEHVYTVAREKGATDFECIEIFARAMMLAALQHCEQDKDKTVQIINSVILPNITSFEVFIRSQETPAIILPGNTRVQ